MVTFHCARFPEGVVHIRTDLGVAVTFHDGVAEVGDPEVAAALLRVPAEFGVTRVAAVVDAVPDGAIRDVMAWVDGDRARAARALEVELARGDRARTTLIRALEAMTRDT